MSELIWLVVPLAPLLHHLRNHFRRVLQVGGDGGNRVTLSLRQPRENRGEVNPDLMAFQLLTCPTLNFVHFCRIAEVLSDDDDRPQPFPYRWQ